MSGIHTFRGQGSGLAANKILKAIAVFPSTNIKVWINQGLSFTVNPVDYATAVSNTVHGRYVCFNGFFVGGRFSKKPDIKDFRNEAHYHSLTEPDGVLHRLCQMFLNGAGIKGGSLSEGIILKKKNHTDTRRGAKKGSRAFFYHEVQFVLKGRVLCVWKLEREGVNYGEDEEGNRQDDIDAMRAAITEMTSSFVEICEKGRAALNLN
jgi:hypothetical protein